MLTPSRSWNGILMMPRTLLKRLSVRLLPSRQSYGSHVLSESAIRRGEKIESLAPKLDDLAATGTRFRKSAVTIKRKLWWKNVKVWFLMFFVIFVRMPSPRDSHVNSLKGGKVVVAIITVVLLLALKIGVA